MVRTIAMLVAAISMSRPAIPKEEATRYAKVLNEMGSKHDFDPLYAVAMVHYESHWLPSVASDDGEDYGLGQVRARFIGACKSDEDPIGSPSEGCKAVKVNLLVGENNLRAMGGIIAANKKMCAEKRGKNKPEFWIAGYQGLSNPERNKYCVPGPTTTRVLEYHKDLLAALVPAPKAKAIAVAKGAPAAAAKGAPAANAKGAPAAKVTTVAKAGPAKGATPAKSASTKAEPAAKANGNAAKAGGAVKPAAKATKPATKTPAVKTAPPAKTAPAKAAKGVKPRAQAQTAAPHERQR